MQDSHELTIAASGTTSTVAEAQGWFVVGIEMPAAWTAATIAIQVSRQNVENWLDLYDRAGTKLALTVAADRVVYLDPILLLAGSRIRLVSSNAQTAERAIQLLVRSDR